MAEEPWLEWGCSMHSGKEWFLWVPAFDPYGPGHDRLAALLVGRPVPVGGVEVLFERDDAGVPRARWLPPGSGETWQMTLAGRGIYFLVPHDTDKWDVYPVALEAAAGLTLLLG